VAKSLHGALIGIGGAVVQEMQRESGAMIVFETQPDEQVSHNSPRLPKRDPLARIKEPCYKSTGLEILWDGRETCSGGGGEDSATSSRRSALNPKP